MRRSGVGKSDGLNDMIIEISCVEVWREISNYLDSNVDSELRTRIEAHFKTCKHCSAVHDGTRNVMRLIGDGRAFEVPASFSERLYNKLPNR
jgi:anti-sigma factor RsiW